MHKNIPWVLAVMLQSFITSAQFQNNVYQPADSIADLYQGHELTNFRALALKLTKDLPSDEAKTRAIYRWVCTNIRNDYTTLKQVNKAKAKLGINSPTYARWSAQKRSTIMNRLIRKKKTICNGYAYLFRELAWHAGLEVVTIDGYSRNTKINIGESDPVPNHSWNAVKIDGLWEFIDTTWGSGFVNEVGAFQFRFDTAHFLTDPELFAQTHHPLEQYRVTSYPPISLDEFIHKPLAFADAAKYKLLAKTPNKYHNEAQKGETITFSIDMGNPAMIDLATLHVIKDGSIKNYVSLNKQHTDKGSELKANWYPETSGTYFVDLLIEERPCYRWLVQVP